VLQEDGCSSTVCTVIIVYSFSCSVMGSRNMLAIPYI
jgi:hypothetical protein